MTFFRWCGQEKSLRRGHFCRDLPEGWEKESGMRVAEKKSVQADEIASAEVERPCIFKT